MRFFFSPQKLTVSTKLIQTIMMGPVTVSQLAAFSWDVTLHITLPSHLHGFFLGSIVQGVCAIGLYLNLLTFVTDEVRTPKEHTCPRIIPYSMVRGLPVQRLQHRAGDPRSLSYYQNTKHCFLRSLCAVPSHWVCRTKRPDSNDLHVQSIAKSKDASSARRQRHTDLSEFKPQLASSPTHVVSFRTARTT